ncbi:hypothetical protein TDB9533_00966 [Thalassocella blandensis]|nr:hypothetical protein TDB9533_00966 [Thalassocella blandensis]
MGFFRQLSPSESLYIAQDTEAFSPFVNQFIVEGKGKLDPEKWRQAVDIVSQKNPGLSLKLKGISGWRYWDKEGAAPEVLTIASDWDGICSEDAPDFSPSINPRRDPVASITLISGETSHIVFRTHHAITDGMGLLHWMKEVFRALRNETLIGAPGTKTETDLPADVMEKRTVTPIQWRDCLTIAPISQTPEATGYGWHRFHWEGSRYMILSKLLLALSQVAWDFHGEGKIAFRIPSDLRSYLDKEEPYSTANLAGVIDFEVTPSDTVKSIQMKMGKIKKQYGDLKLTPKWIKLLNWMPSKILKFPTKKNAERHKTGRYCATANVSHLGHFEAETYSTDDFTATDIFAVPIALDSRSFLTIFTTETGLSATVGMPKALGQNGIMKEVCEKIVHKLNEI